MTVIGIDLGTTNTVAAIAQKTILLKGEEAGSPFLPSVVSFLPNGSTLIGATARRRRVIDSKNTIFSAKRLIGRRWHSWETKTFRKLYPFDLAESPEGLAMFQTRRGPVSPRRIATMVLTSLAEEAGLDLAASRVVITVPSMFKRPHREATLAAASAAGATNVSIADEPVAVTHAYASLGLGGAELVTVYDLGGGTFDLAVVDCSHRPFRVLGHGGDLYLGGDDIDQLMARDVAGGLVRDQGWDLADDPEVFARLVIECERVKKQLSYSGQASLSLGQIDPAAPLGLGEVSLDRSVVEELSRDLVRRTFTICDHVLSEVGITAGDIDAVFLAGGTTQLPMIREGLRKYFGREPRCEFDPMEVVSIGASLMSESREMERTNWQDRLS